MDQPGGHTATGGVNSAGADASIRPGRQMRAPWCGRGSGCRGWPCACQAHVKRTSSAYRAHIEGMSTATGRQRSLESSAPAMGGSAPTRRQSARARAGKRGGDAGLSAFQYRRATLAAVPAESEPEPDTPQPLGHAADGGTIVLAKFVSHFWVSCRKLYRHTVFFASAESFGQGALGQGRPGGRGGERRLGPARRALPWRRTRQVLTQVSGHSDR